MARIVMCDYLKTILEKDEETYKIIVGEHEFEVGKAGLKALLEQLEGEEAPGIQTVEKIVYRDAPPPSLVAAPPGIDIEVVGDPFEPGPESMPMPTQGAGDDLSMPNTAAAAADDDVPPLEIPSNITKKFKMPTPAQADRIIADSTVFEEGSLPSLTMGGKQQKAAMKKLRIIEAQKEKELQRSARGGVRINTDIRDKPGYYD